MWWRAHGCGGGHTGCAGERTWWRAHGCGGGGHTGVVEGSIGRGGGHTAGCGGSLDVVEGTAVDTGCGGGASDVVEGTRLWWRARHTGCGGGPSDVVEGTAAVVEGTWLWFLQKSGMPSTLLLQVRSECNGKMASNFRRRSWPSSAPFIEDDPCATSFPGSSLHAMKDVVFQCGAFVLQGGSQKYAIFSVPGTPYIWN